MNRTEAIKILRETHDKALFSVRTALETLIPELKESEDERIRSALIRGFNSMLANQPIGTFYGEPIKDILAYLEKQKEQKPAEWSEEYREEDLRTRFAFYTYKDEDGVLYLSNVFVEETSRNKGLGTKILAAAEKVAETIGAITIRLRVKQNSPANAWYRKHGYGFMAFEGDYDWLEKTLEYMKPVKPEWSEEDKVMLNNIIWGIHMKSIKPLDEMDDRSKYEKYEDFLKSLPDRFNLQPKQEWSEEDEKKIYFLSRLIEFQVKNDEYCFSEGRFVSKKEAIKMLKSLRPSWKPSEEQMEALKNSAYGTYQNGDGPALRELYEQLKKL